MTVSNLPLELSSFIGRAAELERVAVLLQSHRLVTITGPGGIGKTRLALRAAAAMQHLYRDGVWLADLSRPTALPIIAGPNKPRACQQLIVLDNCEHVVGPCAQLALSCLESYPEVRILATSREVLQVPGEAILLTPPLSLPTEHERSAEKLQQSESGRLFLERVATSVPEFVLTSKGVPTVADLCRQLEGVPLALELAAARVRGLGLSAVASLAADPARMLDLAGRGATLPGRQKTLRASLDWSFNRLAENERKVLRRLAVRRGGWSLADARTACADDNSLAATLPSVMESLVARSLVSVEHRDVITRYRLLESLRHYALEQTPVVPAYASLTPRETEVLGLLATGCSNKEIGVQLAIASATARVHVEHILAKLDLRSRTQAAVWALSGETRGRRECC